MAWSCRVRRGFSTGKTVLAKIVCVRHELALQPGLAIFEEYPELNAGKVKLNGDKVVEFPRLPEMQQVTLKVLRWEERDKHLVIKEAQMVA